MPTTRRGRTRRTCWPAADRTRRRDRLAGAWLDMDLRLAGKALDVDRLGRVRLGGGRCVGGHGQGRTAGRCRVLVRKPVALIRRCFVGVEHRGENVLALVLFCRIGLVGIRFAVVAGSLGQRVFPFVGRIGAGCLAGLGHCRGPGAHGFAVRDFLALGQLGLDGGGVGRGDRVPAGAAARAFHVTAFRPKGRRGDPIGGCAIRTGYLHCGSGLVLPTNTGRKGMVDIR